MDSDETQILPKRQKTVENVFEIGDRTIHQLQNQDFEVGDEEFGTVVLSRRTQAAPVDPAAPAAETAQAADPAPVEPEDPIVRLEQKLDVALRMIIAMQHRLEALDATLAKLLMR